MQLQFSDRAYSFSDMFSYHALHIMTRIFFLLTFQSLTEKQAYV